MSKAFDVDKLYESMDADRENRALKTLRTVKAKPVKQPKPKPKGR